MKKNLRVKFNKVQKGDNNRDNRGGDRENRGGDRRRGGGAPRNN